MSILRKFIDFQISLSKFFDRLLPQKFRIDGNKDFLNNYATDFFKKNLRVYEIGGGKNPVLSPSRKKELGIFLVGLDIDPKEMEQAPEGAYDESIVEDITNYRGREDGDLVVCQAVLEHVKDPASAFLSISSILKPGGIALIFVPSRNAVYARLNLILPQKFKKFIFFKIFPKAKRDQGFPSFYEKCNPREFEKLAKVSGFEVFERKFYFSSDYFKFFFPLYFFWRLWILIFYFFEGNQASETFTFALKKFGGRTAPDRGG